MPVTASTCGGHGHSAVYPVSILVHRAEPLCVGPSASPFVQVDTFGSADENPLVWVMGFGNEADSRHERWLIDQFVDAGYRVHAVELPTNDTDFEGGYLGPVRELVTELDDPVLVAHSMGGLVTAHLQPTHPVVYLSPWWGMDIPAPLRPILHFPTTLRVLPAGIDAGVLGELAEPGDSTAPARLSPAWLRAMVDAQSSMPPIDEDAPVFYTPDDELLSVAAIRERTVPDQRHPYEGGHESFSSRNRDEIADRIITALDGM